MTNAAEKAFADRAIVLDENAMLFEQNNKRATRKSTKATVVGTAKILSYKDIIEARRRCKCKFPVAAHRTVQDLPHHKTDAKLWEISMRSQFRVA